MTTQSDDKWLQELHDIAKEIGRPGDLETAVQYYTLLREFMDERGSARLVLATLLNIPTVAFDAPDNKGIGHQMCHDIINHIVNAAVARFKADLLKK